MRYCPACDSEYQDEVKACAEDGSPLLDRAAYELERDREGRRPMPLARMVDVGTFDSRFEAEEIATELVKESFDVSIVSTRPGVAGPLTSPLPAEWSIVVPEEQAARASALVDEMRDELESSTDDAERAATADEAAGEQPSA